MLNFATDYMYGALPEVMQALNDTNMEATAGYGEDPFCEETGKKIKAACGCPDWEVHFTIGGTQTNATVIDSISAPGQGVLAADSAHINVHESGAVEAYGHKVLPLPQSDGKIRAMDLEDWITGFYADPTWRHMVEPACVYITFPTEHGALYTLKELEEIHSVCQKFGKPLYIDGARLGYGLAAAPDVRLEDLPRICEVFYIGGTKQGTLFGEAVVAKPGVLHNFFTQTKRHCGLLAKGRLLGVQFSALFTDDLYLESSRRAVALAMKLRNAFIEAGYEPVGDSRTNQQFFALPNNVMDRLSRFVAFDLWGARGKDMSTVRFATSWATTHEDIDNLRNILTDIAGECVKTP